MGLENLTTRAIRSGLFGAESDIIAPNMVLAGPLDEKISSH